MAKNYLSGCVHGYHVTSGGPPLPYLRGPRPLDRPAADATPPPLPPGDTGLRRPQPFAAPRHLPGWRQEMSWRPRGDMMKLIQSRRVAPRFAVAAMMTLAALTAASLAGASASALPTHTRLSATSAPITVATRSAAPSSRPISKDAPYDSPATNAPYAALRKIAPPPGTDFGHLPRWKKYSGGRVLLREDRVDVRLMKEGVIAFGYTNVNPKLRSYWLDKDAVIYVSGYNLYRITGRIPRGHWDGQYRVTRQEFLDGFNTHGNEHDRCSKFVSVFRLYFDRTHTHVRKIEEIIPDVTLRCL